MTQPVFERDNILTADDELEFEKELMTWVGRCVCDTCMAHGPKFPAEFLSRVREKERERCAKIAEMDSVLSWVGGSTGSAKDTAANIAAAIRRGG